MNTTQLQNFISIAQTLNYSEAAKNAYISQPALTKQINRLEAELGVTLFDRSKHGVSLTFAGEEFYKYASDILDSIKQAENRMASIRYGRTGFLRISSVYSMEQVISRSIAEFSERYPDISVSIQVGTGTSQILTIRKMSYDVFFSFTDLLQSFPNVDTIPVASDRFAVYIHNRYLEEYRTEGTACLNRLKHFVEVSSEGPFLTNKTYTLIDCLSLPPENVVYYPSSTAIIIAVRAGLGFALLPLEMNHGAIPPDISVIPLDLPEAEIHRAVGWNRDNKSIAVHNYIDLLRE